MMLRQTPQILKKSGIKKEDAVNYLAFISESSMFVLKNRVLKSDVMPLAGKKRSLHSLWSVE